MENRFAVSNAIIYSEYNALYVPRMHSMNWKTNVRIANTSLGLLKMIKNLSDAPNVGTKLSVNTRNNAPTNNAHLFLIRAVKKILKI